MSMTLDRKLSKKTTVILGFGFLALFLPFYIYIISLFQKAGIDPTQYMMAWMSFRADRISELHRTIRTAGDMTAYILMHRLNIISMLFYSISFFFLNLLIVQNLANLPRLKRVGYYFTFTVIAIWLFDLLVTVCILAATSTAQPAGRGLIVTVSTANLVRIPLVNISLLWMLVMLVYLLVRKKNKAAVPAE